MAKSASGFYHSMAWNMLGHAAPVLIALLAIPILIKQLGIERFGVLSLVMALIGFMNVFDFGLTRAITNEVSLRRQASDCANTKAVIKLGMLIMLCISLLISTVVIVFKDGLLTTILNVSDDLRGEAGKAMFVVAMALPFVLIQSANTAVMEAFGEFKKIAKLKLPFSVLSYAIPLVISVFAQRLDYVVAGLCLVRILMMLTFLYQQRVMIADWVNTVSITKVSAGPETTRSILKSLLVYGGWVSISNFIAPLMMYADRFWVSTILGASVVAFYTTPYEMVSKISVVALSVSGVIFPRFVAALDRGDCGYANKLFNKSLLTMIGLLFVPVMVLVLFSDPIISIWISPEFAAKSSQVLSILAVGFFIHALLQPAFLWIQASGKPWITALVHVIDFTLYVFYFPWLVKQYGINGAALAWLLRVSMSFVMLHLIRIKLRVIKPMVVV